jgi:F-type H+-transporting ATPase subunit b
MRFVRRLAVGVPLLGLAPFGLAGAAHAAGMPQLDFSTPLTIAQVVWGVLIFGGLYMLLSWWALPKATAVLATRASTVAGDLDAARMAMAQADGAVAELTAATAKARAEAQAAVNQAAEQAKQAAAAQAADLNAKLEARLSAAETQIEQARAAAMASVHQVARETAATVLARLTGQSPDPALLASAVDAALVARGR